MKPRPKTVLTLLLIAVAISAQAQREKIVEQPRAVFANTFALEIAKVTLLTRRPCWMSMPISVPVVGLESHRTAICWPMAKST